MTLLKLEVRPQAGSRLNSTQGEDRARVFSHNSVQCGESIKRKSTGCSPLAVISAGWLG